MKSLICFVLALALFELPALAAPKEQPVAPPPPMAQPQNLSIFRGRSIDIPLRGIGRTPGQLKFLIRSKPSHGTLSEIRTTGLKTAVVTYTHDGKSGPEQDTFTYAVQTSESPVSAPGNITLAISEEPSALSVVHSVDFGQVTLGDSGEEEITLQNAGGGILSGRMVVPEPWRILGSPEYKLARRQEKKVRILFAPKNEQEYTGKVLFSGNSTTSVLLTGGAVSPFSFTPAKEIELAAKEGTSVRSGTLVIRNATARERGGQITLPSELIPVEEVSLPAGQETKIELRTRDGFLQDLTGHLTFESEGFETEIPLRVFAVKPTLVATPASEINFGSVRKNERKTSTLTLRNEGGSPARLRATLPKDVLLIPDPDTIVIAPGQSHSFDVALEPAVDGDYEGILQIETGETTPLKIALSGSGILPQPTPTASQASGLPVSGIETDSSTSPAAKPTPSPDYNGIPQITDISTVRSEKRQLEIGWPKPSPNALSFLMEYRVVEPDKDGTTLVRWEKAQRVKYREENGRVIAKLENLPPNQAWTIQISSIDELGRRSEPSPAVRIVTPAARPVPWKGALIGIVVVAAGILLFKKIKARRAGDEADDAARISRLDQHL